MVENLRTFQQVTCCTKDLYEERRTVSEELYDLENRLRNLIDEYANIAQSQEEYGRKYGSLYADYEQELNRIDELDNVIRERKLFC